MRKFIFCASLASAIAFSAAASAQTVGIAASKKGSIYDRSATAIAKVATNKGGLNATIRNFDSPNVYIPAINKGQVDFGLANRHEVTIAVEGKEHFEGRKHTNLRAVAIMYPLRSVFFVKKDSDIKTIRDLKGKTMPGGYVAHKVILMLMDAVLATEGMTQKDFGSQVPVPNVVAGGNAFIAGKTDGFLFAIGGPKTREANAKHGIRALLMENTPENLAAIRKFMPTSYLRLEKPGKASPGVVAPGYSMAYDALVFGHKGTSDEAAYKLAKAMHDNKADMAKAFPVLNMFNQKSMVKDFGPVQWHPGAIKFYKEKGLWPPKQ